jgi:mannose-6-phosphate isomerase-like protein (cupin superfamily)
MKTLACCLLSVTLPAAVAATPARVARAGELEGKVEVQLQPADPWRPVTRNLPLTESAWVRTAAGARLEIELDDGSAFRLTGDALCELSDYTRLSTGQRVTVLSLDHGVAYFTGEPDRRDALILVLPGAQATVRVGTRVRLEARHDATQFAVLEGRVRFSSPGAEMDLAEGEMTRVEKAIPSRFFLYREIPPMDTDGWNEQRDRALATSGSARHLPGLRYGLVDLDTNGSWIVSNDAGAVWKPKVAPGSRIDYNDMINPKPGDKQCGFR